VTPPTGEQFELALGEQRAVVVEVGGGLRTYTVDGRDILDGYGPDEPAASGRGQVLIPWPNRIQDGTYDFDGQRHRLELTEPERNNAIHGLVRNVPWRVAEREGHRVVMEHLLDGPPGYPFSLELRIEYVLANDGLTVTSTATNVAGGACPYGAGAHPYLTAGTPQVDTTVVRVPAETVLLADARGIPSGAMPVEGTELDFREPSAVGDRVLDHCFTDLLRDEDGRARVELRSRDTGHSVTLWVDGSYGYLMLFTGDTLPSGARRSLAVEPMTCAPNAFQSGDGLVRLEPGEKHTGTWGIEPYVPD
jgi:aldose 1-epimerase